MLKILLLVGVVLLALFYFFPSEMEEALDGVSEGVESITDSVGSSSVSLAPADTTALELSLLEAASAGDGARLRELLGQGANINGRRSDGSTALMVAAVLEHDELVRMLIERGASVDARDTRGRTTLLLMAGKGRVDVAKLLLENGADPNLASKTGNSPLIEASRYGSSALVRDLLSHGVVYYIESRRFLIRDSPRPATTYEQKTGGADGVKGA